MAFPQTEYPPRSSEYWDEMIHVSVPCTIYPNSGTIDYDGIGYVDLKNSTISQVFISSLNPEIVTIKGTGIIDLEPPDNRGKFQIMVNGSDGRISFDNSLNLLRLNTVAYLCRFHNITQFNFKIYYIILPE